MLTALLVLVAGAAVVVAVLSLQSAPTTLVSERTVTVANGVIQTVVSGSGNLEPARQVDVDFATSGKITKVYTKAGAHVSEGELLARIDNRSQKVAVAKAEADLVDAQDALTKAQDAEAAGTTSATSSTATTSGDATTTAASATAASAATARTSAATRVATAARVSAATATAARATTASAVTARTSASPVRAVTARSGAAARAVTAAAARASATSIGFLAQATPTATPGATEAPA
ncbi:biotin/lipoyl-binding protein, partial [Solirubrobacter ginsenosidimutans]